MKYKEQALSKIEQIRNQMRHLEFSLNRGLPAVEVKKVIDNIKDLIDRLDDNISNEEDSWK
jgi:hypothetical protein